MTYVHDPDFEADFLESDSDFGLAKEEEMTLGDRLSIMTEEFYKYRSKKVEEYDDAYVHALFRDMADLLDDCGEEFYNREVNYLFFKLLNTPIGHKYMKTRPGFTECWKIHGEELLINIDLMTSVDFMWENTRSAVLDFFNDAYYIFVEFGFE
jgi:hypothetical protein